MFLSPNWLFIRFREMNQSQVCVIKETVLGYKEDILKKGAENNVVSPLGDRNLLMVNKSFTCALQISYKPLIRTTFRLPGWEKSCSRTFTVSSSVYQEDHSNGPADL